MAAARSGRGERTELPLGALHPSVRASSLVGDARNGQSVAVSYSFVRPSVAVAQSGSATAVAYALGRAKGYEGASSLFVIACVLVAAGGWLAYYSRTSVLGHFVSPGRPRDGAAARWLAAACIGLIAAGVGVVVWTVLVIGRA
jgi:hypothetical protein